MCWKLSLDWHSNKEYLADNRCLICSYTVYAHDATEARADNCQRSGEAAKRVLAARIGHTVNTKRPGNARSHDGNTMYGLISYLVSCYADYPQQTGSKESGRCGMATTESPKETEA